MALLLQGVFFRVRGPYDRNILGLDLVPLALSGRLDDSAHDADAISSVDGVQVGVVGQGIVRHHLKVFESGAVVDVDKRHRLGGAAGLDPALDQHLGPWRFKLHEVFDSGAAHRRCLLHVILAPPYTPENPSQPPLFFPILVSPGILTASLGKPPGR